MSFAGIVLIYVFFVLAAAAVAWAFLMIWRSIWMDEGGPQDGPGVPLPK